MLYQLDSDGDKGVVAFLSRGLRGAEKFYTTTEQELLAIIFALQRCEVYLWGADVIVRTDHRALTFINQCRFINDRLTRWLLYLQRFRLTVEHIKGRENVIADTLSRHVHTEAQGYRNSDDPIIAAFQITETSGLRHDLKRLPELQLEDQQLAPFLQDDNGQGPYVVEKRVVLHTNPHTGVKTIATPTTLQERLT